MIHHYLSTALRHFRRHKLTTGINVLCLAIGVACFAAAVGVVGFFDLRLHGLFRRVPLNAAWSLMPWGKLGFALAAMTGVTFFIGAPDQYVNNIAFYAKLAFLLIAGLNAAAFEIFYSDAVKASAAVNATPLVFRAIAVVSMVSWFFVIYWGRMLPFVGNAF